jgi:uncharacterized protein Yka (UPF0111/DUF47 family)
MVFPIESEDRTMRNLLMLCQDNVRLVVESFRKALVLFDSLSKEGGAPPGVLDDLHRIMEEAASVRGTLIGELNDVGGILVTRDDFFRLMGLFGDMMDGIESLSFLLVEMKTRNIKVQKKDAEGVAKMADLAFDSLLKLKDGVMSLGFNSERAISYAGDVDGIEKSLDALYAKVDLDIISSHSDLPTILILREIASKLETLVDKAQGASDLVRIITL